MNKLTDILTARNAFIASLVLAAIFMAFLAPKAAVNVDEMLHYPHATKVVNWYFTGGADDRCLESSDNLQFYGQSVDNFTALVNRVFAIENEFLTRHFTGVFFFLLLLVFSALMGKQITGSYWTSTIVVISLLLTPRLFGQAFGNLKDIPFAAGYVAAIYFILRFLKEMPKPRWSSAFYIGLAIAFTCSVRIGGLILFGYLGLGLIALLITKPFLLKYLVSTKLCFVRLMGQGILIALVGYFASLVFWPYALQNVFQNPLESLSVMEHYKVSIKQIYDGDVVWSSHLPWDYLIKWIAISTPEFLILGFIYFTAFLTYRFSKPLSEQLFYELFLFFTLLFPVVYVMVIGANLYSGIRQMLFVIPILVVLASIGVYNVLKLKSGNKFKIAGIVSVIVLMLLPLKHQASTFPADYVYFNAISGGNSKAWSNYEYDYYFHGIKEASDYLFEEIGDEQAKVAMNTQLPNYFENKPNIDFVYTRYLERSSHDWDYGLFGVNYIHPWQLKNNTWQSTKIVKTFYHKGNPLVVLIKRDTKKDLLGIEALKTKNWEAGEEKLKIELQKDPNNVWLIVNLAILKLAENKTDEFDDLLNAGRKIHPRYEPFYLLEAQKLYNKGKYEEAMLALNELIEVNPRYKNAKPLLKAVKQKLNNN